MIAVKDFVLEVETQERDALVASARFSRFALEQESLNAQLERNPDLAHATMGSVLKSFRDFAEAREGPDRQLETARACRAAFGGDVKAVMAWVEQKQKLRDALPDCVDVTRVTPLIAAAMGKRHACVSLLLSVCDQKAVDSEGRSALDHAQEDAELRALLV
jgi:hypothetical protein